jgi:hypothetical protein
MGDSDRMKNYISDYLENSLDPSTHKEFEDTLKKSPELRSMTDRVAAVSSQLSNLQSYKCSDDFSVKLREKIHTSSEPIISRQNIVRYSFAASFVIILVIATLTITNLSSDSPESAPALQGTTQNPANNPNPVSSTTKQNTRVEEGEMGINQKSSQDVYSDSSRVQQEKKKNKPPIKLVDQEK